MLIGGRGEKLCTIYLRSEHVRVYKRPRLSTGRSCLTLRRDKRPQATTENSQKPYLRAANLLIIIISPQKPAGILSLNTKKQSTDSRLQLLSLRNMNRKFCKLKTRNSHLDRGVFAIIVISIIQLTMLAKYLGIDDPRKEIDDAPVSVGRSAKSAFVSSADLFDTEDYPLPGIYEYGPGNRNALIITGASLLSEYHAPENVWFQLFAMGHWMFESDANFQGGNNGCTDNTNKTLNKLKPWDEMANEPFYCQVGSGQMEKMELVPTTEGYDTNTNAILQVWRCSLYSNIPGQNPILPRSDVKQFLTAPTDDVALPVDVFYKESAANFTKILQVVLPLSNPNVGLNKPILKSSKTPVSQQRHNITLCIHGKYNGLMYLNEYIRYHHDIIGIDHLHLGLDTELDGAEDSRVMQVARNLLRREIDAGTISVSTLWDEKRLGVKCEDADLHKAIFYQTCLWRAKGSSEFVATWDTDEYILIEEEKENEQRMLYDFLQGLSNPECNDWSYVTMKSSFAGGGHPKLGLVSEYPMRDNTTNVDWQKSISRTKNVFLNSFHIPGSSLPEGKTNVTTDLVAMHPEIDNHKCAFYTDDAIMVHFMGIYDRGAMGLTQPIPNKLASLMLGRAP